MVEIDLRNALEYDVADSYKIFKPDYENLSYSDIDSRPEIPRMPTIKTFNQYQEFLKESNLFFITTSDDDEIGYIILDVTTGGTAKIKEMMVRSQFRGRGYGKKAIKVLLDGLSEDEEIKEVIVFSATIATDCFYSSCGFQYESGDTYKYQLRN